MDRTGPHKTLTPRRFNSLDRRVDSRHARQVEITTFGDDLKFRKVAVIECSERGARVVFGRNVAVNDTVGVIVQWGAERIRTFARVAWTNSLQIGSVVAGLEFL